jgi:hypothetical protein
VLVHKRKYLIDSKLEVKLIRVKVLIDILVRMILNMMSNNKDWTNMDILETLIEIISINHLKIKWGPLQLTLTIWMYWIKVLTTNNNYNNYITIIQMMNNKIIYNKIKISHKSK